VQVRPISKARRIRNGWAAAALVTFGRWSGTAFLFLHHGILVLQQQQACTDEADNRLEMGQRSYPTLSRRSLSRNPPPLVVTLAHTDHLIGGCDATDSKPINSFMGYWNAG